jgi:hypothetical protein
MERSGRIKGMDWGSMSIIRAIPILATGVIISLLKVSNILYQRYSLNYIQAPMSLRMANLTKDKFITVKPDLESIDMPTATSMKDSGTRILSKVMASCIILIKIRTKANGSKEKRMDMALTITTMVLSIKVILLMVEKTEWAQ